MKTIHCMLLALITNSLLAQTEKNYSKPLGDLIKVTDYLYMDATEVTNGQWKEFVNSKAEDNRSAYIPNANVWSFADYRSDYYPNERFDEYPVVGITWRQANDYCSWRNDLIKSNENKVGKLPPYFAFRLPSHSEFLLVYENTVLKPDQIGEEGKKKYRGMWRYNLKRQGDAEQSNLAPSSDNGDVIAPSKSYWPNDMGVYNLRGNVSEWLMEEHTHAGGSWRDMSGEDHSSAKHETEAKAYIGFRCACEVAFQNP